MGFQVRRGLLAAASVVACLSAGTVANAGIVQFSGGDDGAPTTGPFPNSAAAQTLFLSAAGAFGSVNTATFEGVTTGFYSPIAAGPGLSIDLTGTDFGAGFSGVTTTTDGSLFGFNTTSGGSTYLGTSGDTVTFNFASGTHSLGMFMTGLQTIFTSSLQITFDDGTSQTLNLPINVNGGAEYFGFTDTNAFDSATLTDVSTGVGTDAWGIDDVSYNGTSVTPVPEPMSLSLFGTGALIGLGLLRRRRKTSASTESDA